MFIQDALPVEIVSDTDWWLPWLPVLGSMIVAGAALLGVAKSNKTNRDAITAADNRAIADRAEARDKDFREWQRDTLLRLASEAIDAALGAEDEYRRVASIPRPLDLHSIDAVELAGRKIGVCGLNLRLIGAHEAADRCRDIRSAVASRDLLEAFLNFHRDYVRTFDPENEGNDELQQVLAARRDEFDRQLAVLNFIRGNFGETVERELRRLSYPGPAPS